MDKLKKFATVAILAAMMAMPLAGCGGSDSTDEPAVEKTEATQSTSSSSSSDSSSSEGVSDETFDALQTQYAALVELYNYIKDAHETGVITLDDDQLEVVNDAADAINEVGELDKSSFTSDEDVEELSSSIADLGSALSDIYDAAEAAGQVSDEGVTDDMFEGVQEAYSSLVDLYNMVKEGVESGTITPTDEQTATINEAADIINEMGDLEKSDITSQKDALDLLTSMSQIADVLGSVVD